jgi:hypothetical protein
MLRRANIQFDNGSACSRNLSNALTYEVNSGAAQMDQGYK